MLIVRLAAEQRPEKIAPGTSQCNSSATALISSFADAGLVTTGASGHFCLASVASYLVWNMKGMPRSESLRQTAVVLSLPSRCAITAAERAGCSAMCSASLSRRTPNTLAPASRNPSSTSSAAKGSASTTRIERPLSVIPSIDLPQAETSPHARLLLGLYGQRMVNWSIPLPRNAMCFTTVKVDRNRVAQLLSTFFSVPLSTRAGRHCRNGMGLGVSVGCITRKKGTQPGFGGRLSLSDDP
jgi:hypothetical protein